MFDRKLGYPPLPIFNVCQLFLVDLVEMRPQIRSLCEILLANLALIGLLPRVGPYMILQMDGESKALPAPPALVLPLQVRHLRGKQKGCYRWSHTQLYFSQHLDFNGSHKPTQPPLRKTLLSIHLSPSPLYHSSSSLPLSFYFSPSYNPYSFL